MESILIADDEKNIREGLKYIIDWESMGFRVEAQASNGEEALEYILTNHPTLVLLDIRMPKMYGTDIIRIAREHGYNGNFIILSGYSDFVYAKTAIEYGVKYYLTKPIDEDELIKAIETISEEIKENKCYNENMRLYRMKAKNVFLHEIVTGTWNIDEQHLSENELEEMQLDADKYKIVLYEKYGIKPEDPQYDFATLLEISNKGNHSFEHFEEDGNEVILLKGNFAIQKFEKLLERYEYCKPQQGSPLDSIFITYGRTVDRIDEVYISFEEALGLLKRRFFCMQEQHTIGYDKLPSFDQDYDSILKENVVRYAEKITDCILAANRNHLVEMLSEIEKYLYNTRNDIDEVRYFLVELYLQIKERVMLLTQRRDLHFEKNTEVIKYFHSCHYLYEIVQFISEQMMNLMKDINNCERDTIIDDVIYYIDRNFQSALTLEEIAPLFGYNSAYLGKIFAKSVGESFNTYVDQKRIEKSMELLKEKPMKVYEIAKMVGYGNVDYFHKKFKKYVGISPAEYRKKIV